MLYSLSGLSFISVGGSWNQYHFSRLVKRNSTLCGTAIGMFGSGFENLKSQANTLSKYQRHSPPSTWDLYCKRTKRKVPYLKMYLRCPAFKSHHKRESMYIITDINCSKFIEQRSYLRKITEYVFKIPITFEIKKKFWTWKFLWTLVLNFPALNLQLSLFLGMQKIIMLFMLYSSV